MNSSSVPTYAAHAGARRAGRAGGAGSAGARRRRRLPSSHCRSASSSAVPGCHGTRRRVREVGDHHEVAVAALPGATWRSRRRCSCRRRRRAGSCSPRCRARARRRGSSRACSRLPCSRPCMSVIMTSTVSTAPAATSARSSSTVSAGVRLMAALSSPALPDREWSGSACLPWRPRPQVRKPRSRADVPSQCSSMAPSRVRRVAGEDRLDDLGVLRRRSGRCCGAAPGSRRAARPRAAARRPRRPAAGRTRPGRRSSGAAASRRRGAHGRRGPSAARGGLQRGPVGRRQLARRSQRGRARLDHPAEVERVVQALAHRPGDLDGVLAPATSPP